MEKYKSQLINWVKKNYQSSHAYLGNTLLSKNMLHRLDFDRPTSVVTEIDISIGVWNDEDAKNK